MNEVPLHPQPHTHGEAYFHCGRYLCLAVTKLCVCVCVCECVRMISDNKIGMQAFICVFVCACVSISVSAYWGAVLSLSLSPQAVFNLFML